VPLGIDNLDGDQLRTAPKLLERENECLVRQVLELKQRLASAEGKGGEQLELLAQLEHQLALRNQKLFGRSSEKRGAAKAAEEAPRQPGHGPREQRELAIVEREHLLDAADHVCPAASASSRT
jgi:transposase